MTHGVMLGSMQFRSKLHAVLCNQLFFMGNFVSLSVMQVGRLVEEVYGAPQDIEGVVIGDDTVALVQTRPQV